MYILSKYYNILLIFFNTISMIMRIKSNDDLKCFLITVWVFLLVSLSTEDLNFGTQNCKRQLTLQSEI